MTPNKALQLTANPLRGLSAAELGRYAAKWLLRAAAPEVSYKDLISARCGHRRW